MGTVQFQSRKYPHQIFFSDLIFGTNESDEDLHGYQKGDYIALIFDLDSDAYAKWVDKELPGVIIQNKALIPTSEDNDFEIVIDFVITQRVHTVSEDWMPNHIGRGWRSSSVTIYLQPLTDAGEEIFVAIHKNNGTNLKSIWGRNRT